MQADTNWLSLAREFVASAQLMGVLLPDLGTWTEVGKEQFDALAARLAALRTEAMATKDFAAVDALKAALVAAGVEVRMGRDGVTLAPGAGFDAAKLEGLE